jgi:hypothetical protein
MVAVINRRAAYSPDAELRQWGWSVREAIERFQGGEASAFADLAARNALAEGVIL